MALNRANKEPNSVLQTPYITIDGQILQLGGSGSLSSVYVPFTNNISNLIISNTGSISLNTAGSTRLIIDSSGNFGINGASPAARLNIQSSTSQVLLNLTNTTTTNWVQATMTRVDNTNQQVAWVYYPTGTLSGTNPYWSTGINAGSSSFSINSYDGTTLTARLVIDTSGNITGTPSAATVASASTLGYVGLPQNLNPTTYTLTAADNGKHIYYTTSGQTVTIPANATLALPVGFSCVVVNAAAVTTTIAITTDTLIFAGTGTTGSRTLAPYGMATLLKITSNSWMVTGNGLS